MNTHLHQYGITIDDTFVVIAERRPAVRGPFVRASLGKRIWKWIRRTAGKVGSAGIMRNAPAR